MTHEIKNFIELIWKSHQQNIKSVLATVVALEGSSYRRPGVRMLIPAKRHKDFKCLL